MKKEIKEIIINTAFPLFSQQDKPLRVIVEVHEDWFCKNGSVKKKDISNREKFLIDSIFDALGLDDKFIFEHQMKKIQSTEEKAVISIEEITND